MTERDALELGYPRPNLRAGKCIMQADGNLVSYDPSGRVIWPSDSDGHPNSYLVVRDEGSVAIFQPEASDRSGGNQWADITGEPAQQLMVLLHFGNEAVGDR